MKVFVSYNTQGQRPDHFTLTKPLILDADDGTMFEVPEGFASDGASIPQLFQLALAPVSYDFPADVFHDYFYMNPSVYTRQQIDAYWLEFMRRFNQKNRLRTWIKYRYVRALGWYNWFYYRR